MNFKYCKGCGKLLSNNSYTDYCIHCLPLYKKNKEYKSTYNRSLLYSKKHIKKCIHCGVSIEKRNSSGYCKHCIQKYCPNRITNFIRKEISDGLKLAHKEGRAYSIGTYDRHRSKPSRPEIWLSNVLKNNNINYTREYRVGKWFFDFFISNTNKLIELDGEQHFKYPQKWRDIEKDSDGNNFGYNLVRLCWKDVCNNSKSYISDIINYSKNKYDNGNILNNKYNLSIDKLFNCKRFKLASEFNIFEKTFNSYYTIYK